MHNKIINNNIHDKLNNEINKIRNNYDKIYTLKNKYKDLTYLKTYTIDDTSTIEIDDAISLEKISNNYKLWVHIASPASYINYDSFIDKYARKQISSLYLASSTIYMFPIELITDIFNLSNNDKRTSLSIGVILNDDGSIFSYEIVQSYVKSTYRLSYSEADELIYYSPKEEEDLSIISKLLENRNRFRKSIGAKEILESQGKVIVKNQIPNIKVIDQTLSRCLISEAMILYGDLISQFTQKNDIPIPYRVQERCGYYNKDNNINTDNIVLFNFLIKKRFGKTYYSSKPMKHYSLGLNSYSHATSPIRRYADLLVHYQINRYLNNKNIIEKKCIDSNIQLINNLSRENINKSREDQKIWLGKWFKKNSFNQYRVILLSWINRNKKISIIYFIEYKFPTICLLETKLDLQIGQIICIKDITYDYNDILNFRLMT